MSAQIIETASGGVFESENSCDREREILEPLHLAADELVVQFVGRKEKGEVSP